MSLVFGVSYYNLAATNVYTLNDVQTVNITRGRRTLIDPYSPGVATITCRNIAAWPAQPRQGQMLRIIVSDNQSGVVGPYVFGGFISDVKISYGLKSSLDEATITVEGPLRNYGRRNPKNLALTQAGASNYISQIETAIGGQITLRVAGNPQSTMSAQTYTGNALDLLNTVTATEVGHIGEYWYTPSSIPAIAWYGRGVIQNRPAPFYGSTYVFADTANTNQNYLEFDGLEFESSSENYYTRVTTNPQGLASQSENKGAAPYVELDVDTFDATTTQADSLAQYLLNTFSSTNSQLTSISGTYLQQLKKATYAEYKSTNFMYLLGIYGPTAINVIFRGSTYYSVFEGIEINADPTDTRVTVYLSSQDLNAYLRWDEPSPYNTWDYNKWGF